MKLIDKLKILADAAKYDASCASSGTDRRDSQNGTGIGSSGGNGICHSYAPDGRCISLLKILLTNFCIFECSYCINRASSNVPKARFTVDEIVKLTLDFYKRNYIEGLFLSSGIIKNPDYTMEQITLVAKKLRTDCDFRGYIHLKTIPDASPELLKEAGKYADRLSINIELPTETSLKKLAPEKDSQAIKCSMARLRSGIDEAREAKKNTLTVKNNKSKGVFRFAPAGQSTQMIIGADRSSDTVILKAASQLYDNYHMRRVYYSAFSPIPDVSDQLPLIAPPLRREHRLYQADWLMRFYQFEVDEITTLSKKQNGMLDLDIDPKLAWAIGNTDVFPVNVNRASKHMLLRVPGIGVRSVQKILMIRKHHLLRLDDIKKLRISLKKALPFIETIDYTPKSHILESASLRQRFVNNQQELFPTSLSQ